MTADHRQLHLATELSARAEGERVAARGSRTGEAVGLIGGSARRLVSALNAWRDRRERATGWTSITRSSTPPTK